MVQRQFLRHAGWTFALRQLAAAALLGAAVAGAHAAEGEIKKIDPAQAKVTLKHGAIAKLDMPPITMVYRVKPAVLLDGLAVGDVVDFEADKVDGQYTVTLIRKR